ncbi:MAG: hypothetical protein Q8P13_01055 [bacterium]|nr:hypothetical protein [bacterium]
MDPETGEVPKQAASFNAAAAKAKFEADLNKEQTNHPAEELSKKTEAKESEPQDLEDQFLYHGTNAAFEDELHSGASDHNVGGSAVYLTPSPEQAHHYAHFGGGLHNENKNEQHYNIHRYRLKRGTRILDLDEPLPPEETEQIILKKYASPALASEEAARYKRHYEGRLPQPAEEFLTGLMDLNNGDDRQLLEQMAYKGIKRAHLKMNGQVALEVAIWDPSVLVPAIGGKAEPRTDGRLTQEASDYLKGHEKAKRTFHGRTYSDSDFYEDLPVLKRMAWESGISLTGEETGREIMETLKARNDADKQKDV